MRETCLLCVRKHIAQAIILNIESEMGHPLHKWLATGHLAEAEAECIQKYPDLAQAIRNVRLSLEKNAGAFRSNEMMGLISRANQLAAEIQN